MSTIQVPFETAEERGTSLSLQVPDQNLIRSFIPNEPPPLADVAGAARYAVENPVGSKPLSALLPTFLPFISRVETSAGSSL